jgi:SAM-dependent methyltransferase
MICGRDPRRPQLNWLVRYQPAIACLQTSSRPQSVLEVGSGAVGLACLYPQPFVGCDVFFACPPHPLLQPVIGSATQLPFPDGSFSTIVCLDVFEHIPPSQRPAFLRELLRVARSRVILAFPCGDAARSADRRIANLYRFRRLPPPPWLQEHEQWPLPSAEDLETDLGRLSLPYTRIGNSVWPVHLLLMLLDGTPLGPRLARLVTRHPRSLLPLLLWSDKRRTSRGDQSFYRLVYCIDKDSTP